MEHHLLPRDPTPTTIQVPCVCKPPYYEGQDFLSYPAEKGKPWLVKEEGKSFQLQIGRHELHNPTPVEELESFYQQWLFFGLLKVILADAFRAEDFVSEEEGKKWITTGHLMPHLQKIWTERLASGVLDIAAHLYTVELVHTVTTVLKTTERRSLRLTGRGFDWRIRLPIASLVEQMAAATNLAFDMRNIKLDQRALQFYATAPFPFEDVQTAMKRAGWCPSELHAITTKFQSLEVLYFLSRLKKSEPYKDHEKCTTRLCQCYQTNRDSYISKHTELQCLCLDYSDAELDITIRQILGNGGVPVLKITEVGSSVQVQAIKSTSETNYIAISHVWADGLGNASSNSLPSCQLAKLKRLAMALQVKAFALRNQGSSPENNGGLCAGDGVADGAEHFIWIDTLCCPCEPSKAKNNSILRLRETYMNAALVLVLDATLQTIALETTSCAEVLLRVFSSGWTSRLWTLQEGVLARSLWFQFHDQAEEIAVLNTRLFHEGTKDIRVMMIYQDLLSQFQWLKMLNAKSVADPSGKDTESGERKVVSLTTLDYGLQHRAVSVAADEALCIATLLKLSLEEIQAVPEDAEDRMCKLWKLIAVKYGGIPQKILYLGYPRLPTAGFRWAPRTLLHEGIVYRGRQRILSWADPNLGQPDQNGLLVKCQGYIIKNRQWKDSLLQNPWRSIGFLNSEFPIMTFRDDQSALRFGFMVGSYSRDVAFSTLNGKCNVANIVHGLVDFGPCGIIQLSESQEALMGNIKTLPSGICQIEQPVPLQLWPLETNMTLVFDTAEQIATAARAIPATKRMDDLQRNDQQDSEEFQAAAQEVKVFVHASVDEKLRDKDIAAALWTSFMKTETGYLASLVLDWFWHDYVCQSFDNDQTWYVD